MRHRLLLRLLWLLILGVLVGLSAVAQDLYVTARVAPMQAEATAASRRVTILRQNTGLALLREADDWYEVETMDERHRGWVQALFVGESIAPARMESRSIGRLETVTTRRRANAYGTSAAAARGLSADDVRGRENLAFSEYDFQAAEWLEQFLYPEEEIYDFAFRHGFDFF